MTRLTVIATGLAALILFSCGDAEPTRTMDDLVSHLEDEGVAVEETLDLAVLVKDGTPRERVEGLAQVLDR